MKPFVSSLVTTIIPVFNRANMIVEAVASVLNQSHHPIEIIVVDDGSTDDTPHVLRKYELRHPEIVRVIGQANQGAAAARNTGLQHASGEFIQYLDSDDLLCPEKFTLQVAALRRHPEAGVCYGLTQRKNLKTGDLRVWAQTGSEIDNIFPSFLMNRGWDTNSPLWRRSVCDQIGPWSDLRVMEDWEHDLRAGLLGVTPIRVAEMVAIVRDHGQERASGMSTGFTPPIMRGYFLAHESIWGKMKAGGFTDWPYLEAFSRKMFWIARMCGQRGLYEEAERALSYANEMMRPHGLTKELVCFRMLKNILGWKATTCICEFAYWSGKAIRRTKKVTS